MFILVRVIGVLVCLIQLTSYVDASGYQDWISLLPEKIAGTPKSGRPEGADFTSETGSWSSLNQTYSSDGGKKIKMSIINGSMAPEIRQFKAMPSFQVETSDRLTKSLNLAGHRAILELKKTEKTGRLIISVNAQTIVVLEAEQIAEAGDLLELANDVPIDKIADSIK